MDLVIKLFNCIVHRVMWNLCFAQVDSAVQWLPRTNASFMLILCSKQIPAKVNKYVVSYLIILYISYS